MRGGRTESQMYSSAVGVDVFSMPQAMRLVSTAGSDLHSRCRQCGAGPPNWGGSKWECRGGRWQSSYSSGVCVQPRGMGNGGWAGEKIGAGAGNLVTDRDCEA